jgi:hypothetical protein
MVYIEIKTINGKKYKYLRRAIRTEGKIKKITLKCLGPVNPIYRVRNKRKTNASIYLRSITKAEKDKLSQALHSSNAFARDRARIILLSSEKIPAVAIALKVSCEPRKARMAIKAFNEQGLKALERRKAKGAEAKFSKEDRLAIMLHFSKEPKEFGLHFTSWTLPRFRNHLIKISIVPEISIETIRQMLFKAGAKLTKSKRWQYSPDKNFLRKSRQ